MFIELVLRLLLILLQIRTSSSSSFTSSSTSSLRRLNSNEDIFLTDLIESTNLETVLSWSSSTVSSKCSTSSVYNPYITCQGIFIEKIDLQNKQITGTIPSSISLLNRLSFLRLTNNSFHSTIPSQIGSLNQLQYFYLSMNSFIGSLPDTLSSLSKLVLMEINTNRFTGSLPKLQSLPLSQLILSSNSFQGTIPSTFYTLTMLSCLYIYENSLTGTISPSINSLGRLVSFLAYSNLLVGHLPSSFGSLSLLATLNLRANRLTGAVPNSFTLLTALSSLTLHQNSFSGVYPAQLCSRTLLTTFTLTQSSNQCTLTTSTVTPSISPTSSPSKKPTSTPTNPTPTSSPSKNPTSTPTFTSTSSPSTAPTHFPSTNPTTIPTHFPTSITTSTAPTHFPSTNPTTIPTSTPTHSPSTAVPTISPTTPPTSLPSIKQTHTPTTFPSFQQTSSSTTPPTSTPTPFPSFKPTSLQTQNPTTPAPTLLPSKTPTSATTISPTPKVSTINPTLSPTNSYSTLETIFLCDFIKSSKITWMSCNSSSSSSLSSLSSLKCGLRGISCAADNTIQQINFTSSSLYGTIPPSIGSLTKLISIDLNQNSLTGYFPSQIIQLNKLTLLNLKNNLLHGTIPPMIGSLNGLITLDLGLNLFSGNLPSNVGFLTNLTSLNLDSNSFQGFLPSKLGLLTGLSFLSLSSNKFTSVTNYLSKLKQLNSLILTNNQLKGSIPSSILTFSKLEVLMLNQNQFSGSLPSSMKFLTTISRLSISSNNLEGVIPPAISSLISLKSLDLSENKLSGKIPSSLSSLLKLTEMILNNNKLTSSIPSSFVGLTNLEILKLYSNSLATTYPSGLCSSLVKLTAFYYFQNGIDQCQRSTLSPAQFPTQYPTESPTTQLPVINLCSFSSDGSIITIEFVSATDKGQKDSTFVCSLQVSFVGANISNCNWNKEGTILTIHPKKNLNVADSINLQNNTLRLKCVGSDISNNNNNNNNNNNCNSHPTASSSEFCFIRPPVSPATPIVSMTSPSIIGPFDKFIFDISSSSGSGGRSWSVVNVLISGHVGRVTNNNGKDGSTTTNEALNPLQNLFNNEFTSSSLVIPSSYFLSNYTHFFTITVCNFLSICSEPLTKIVFKESFPVPLITIYGSSPMKIQRSNQLTISAFATLNTSNIIQRSSDLNTKFVFKWEVWKNSKILPTLSSSSKDQTKFRLSPYSLNVGETYVVQLTVSYSSSSTSTSSSSISSSSSILVQVEQSKIVALINNGEEEYLLKQGKSLKLDASKSYDEDIPELTGVSAGLSFNWSCVGFNLDSTSSLTLTTSTTPCGLIFKSTGVNMSVMEISAIEEGNKENIGLVWNVSITITDSKYIRFDTTSTIIRIIPPTSPTISLSGPHQIRKETSLVLIGLVNSSTPVVVARWWSDSISSLKSISMTPTSISLNKGTNQINLVIGRNILTIGSTYIFHLSIDNTTSSSSITINIAVPPQPGSFIISPDYGKEYEDNFELDALYWSDSELPLSYSFGYETPSKGLYSLKSRSSSTTLTSTLPQGSIVSGFILKCFVIVYNNLDAFYQYNTSITVNPSLPSERKSTLNSIISQTSDAITSGALDAGQADVIRQKVILGTSILNTVNCSLVNNCKLLNREECGEVNNQCGSCLSGYISMDESNHYSSCVLSKGINSKSNNNNNNNNNNKISCINSTQCSVFEECVNKECIPSSKSCPSNCSGRGKCLYERISTGEVIDECLSSDVTCKSICVCNDGMNYTGEICSIDKFELKEKQENRYNLIKSLNATVAYGEITTDGMTSLIRLTIELSSPSNELTFSSCSLLIEIIDSILTTVSTSGSSLNLNYEDTTGLFPVMDSCLSILSNEDMSVFNKVVGNFADLISSGLVPGMTSQNLNQPSFRMSSLVQSLNVGESISLKVPSNELESSLNVVKSSVIYSPSLKSSISLNIVERLSRYQPYSSTSDLNLNNSTKKSNSNSLQIILNQLEDSNNDGNNNNNNKIENIIVVLEYDKDQFYGNISGTNITITTKCNSTKKSESLFHEYKCPSGQLIVHDCSKLPQGGTLKSICSIQSISPFCGVIMEPQSENESKSKCDVIAFTNRNTTCLCQISMLSSSSSSTTNTRRLQSSSSSSSSNTLRASGALTLMSMAEYTYDGFYETISETDDVSVSDLKASYLVLVMVLIMWGFGSLMFVEEFRLTEKWFISPKYRVRERHRSSMLGGSIVPLDESMETRKKYLLTYLDSIFPDIFHQDEVNWKSILGEIMKHHRYINILTNSGIFSHELRVKTVLQMLTIQTMLMFVLSVCYDLQYPTDTGQCSSYNSESSCLGPSSIFNPSENLCKWISTSITSTSTTSINSNEGYCEYLKPKMTLKTIALISILVATITAPFNLLVDFLFDVIRAPTADSDRLSSLISSGASSIQQTGRRFSAAAVGVTKNVILNVNNMVSIPVSSRKRSSMSEVIFQGLVHEELTRDVPDKVIHSHVLAENALGHSLRDSFIVREKSLYFKTLKSIPKSKPKQIENNNQESKNNNNNNNNNQNGEEEETNRNIGFERRKQRATSFLVGSIKPLKKKSILFPQLSSPNFLSVSPDDHINSIPNSNSNMNLQNNTNKNGGENNNNETNNLFNELINDMSCQYDELTSIKQKEEFITTWG